MQDAAAKRRGVYYGWFVVASVATMLAITAGARFLFGRRRNSEIPRNILCNLPRHGQNVRKIAHVGSRPEDLVPCWPNQFDAELHSLARAHHRCFQYRIYRQFPGDFRRGLPGSFVTHHGGPRNDMEAGALSDFVNQFLGRSIRKDFSILTARHIREGRDR